MQAGANRASGAEGKAVTSNPRFVACIDAKRAGLVFVAYSTLGLPWLSCRPAVSRPAAITEPSAVAPDAEATQSEAVGSTFQLQIPFSIRRYRARFCERSD